MRLNETTNPYRTPVSLPTNRSRVSELTRLFRRLPLVRYFAFRRGDVVIVDGIAFYVDPKDSSRIFAASPSAKNTDDRLELVIAESIRALPCLFSRRPGLKRLVHGRIFVVRLIGSYAEARGIIIREHSLDWETVSQRIQDGDKPWQDD
ncbi:hypothetical protein Rcae01_00004 [Novipirellula caenicola]|uniref:Uncharacterized protein n=1 Tax=Novipirellula caenicola TaxID=1536901 RepID=A0ABP9VJ12_9BACT